MSYIITALIIGYFAFLLIGKRMGYALPNLFRMSLDGLKTALTLMIILLLIIFLINTRKEVTEKRRRYERIIDRLDSELRDYM